MRPRRRPARTERFASSDLPVSGRIARVPGRMGWQVGVLIALASSAVANLGSLLRQRGATAAPDVDIRHPLRTVAGLFRSKWWSIGYACAAVAWLLHVGALAIAP